MIVKWLYPSCYVLMAWTILGFAFQSNDHFWIWFPVGQSVLLLLAILHKPLFKGMTPRHAALGLLSGLFLYGVFAIGKTGILFIIPHLFNDLVKLYSLVQPQTSFQISLVFFVIIPAEEFFWRGYVQTHLPGSTVFRISISSILYAGAHVASGSLLLVLAALIGGIVWGSLFAHSKNILVPLISHLIFDLFLLILLPLIQL